MSLTLTYFDVRGRAEPSRLILHAAGAKFTDKRVKDDWKEIKPTLPWGQMPVLEVEQDGKKTVLHESFAIHRFLARRFGFMGATELEAAEIDALVEDVIDIYRPMMAIRFGPGSDEEKKEKFGKFFKDELVAQWLPKFDKALGKEDWFVGSRVSLADIVFFNLLDGIKNRTGADAFKAFPKLDALAHRVAAIPGIAAWLKARPEEKP